MTTPPPTTSPPPSPASAVPVSALPRLAHDPSEGDRLAEALRARTARVGVVGLGAVGLPLAASLVRAGFPVVGHEIDPERRAALARGESPFAHLPDALVRGMLADPRFELAGAGGAAALDALVLCVPTPLGPDREPDLSAVRAAARSLAPGLARPALVVLESTTYPGTTREVLGAELARAGRTPGVDVLLAFSPERTDPGRRDVPEDGVPKLVGGTCERSARLAAELYRSVFQRVVPVASAEVAEAAKLTENVFRAVNIALVNELKTAFEAMGIDVWEVLDAAATKPFGFLRFDPGPGTGGHCIPVDPFYLAWCARRAGSAVRFVELAGEIDRGMPPRIVERTRAALASQGLGLRGSRVLLLGVAYKPEVDIVTGTPALRLWELFEEAGAEVGYSDPYVCRWDAGGRAARALPTSEATLRAFDVAVLVTHHAAFDYPRIARHARLVVDTRNALAPWLAGRAHYFKA